MIKARTRKRDGRRVYDVRLRGPEGKVYNRTFLTKREAEAFQDAQRVAIRRGHWTDPRAGDMTIEELAADWLAANPAKRSGTKARDESIVRRHISPTLGARSIGSVRQPDVQGMVNAWCQLASPRTVVRQYGVLRGIFAYAVNADLLTRSPCRTINLPEVVPVRRKLPDAAGLAAVADQLGEYAPMLWVGVLLGLRWGEVAGLRVGSVDLLRGELSVTEQRTRDLGDDGETAQPKSAAGRRTMAIPDGLGALLSEHMARRGLTGADTDALLFVGKGGGPLNYSHWRQRVWQPACVRAELGGLTFHDLRRANATGMVADKVDLKTAQTRLGHSDPRLTLAVYAQSTAAGDLEAADGLASRFMPAQRSAR